MRPDVASGNARKSVGPAPTALELISFRVDMLRFAQRHLRDAEMAEDLVQDAIEGALRGAFSFAGHSSPKTWVFAILRNRIIDHIRQAGRTVPMSSLVQERDDWQDQVEALFNETGRWNDGSRPTPWPEPEQCMQNREFWRVFEACLDHMPKNTARVFIMREVLGFDSLEICSHLGISTTNCHVILHRARLKLRDCMEQGWGRPGCARC